MSSGAIRMKTAVSAPRPSSISQSRLDATRHARLRSPFSSRSLKTGTNADETAVSATSARIVFGHEERDLERVDLALDAEVVLGHDLADQAEHARDRGREREDRRRDREPARLRPGEREVVGRDGRIGRVAGAGGGHVVTAPQVTRRCGSSTQGGSDDRSLVP